jgi:hypothetical protein
MSRKYVRGLTFGWSYEVRNIGIKNEVINAINDERTDSNNNVEYPFKFLGQWQIWGKGQKRGSWKFEFKMLAVKKVIKSNRTGFQKALLQIKRSSNGIKGFLAGGTCNRWIILDKEGSDFMRFCIEKELFVNKEASERASTQLGGKLVDASKDEKARKVCAALLVSVDHQKRQEPHKKRDQNANVFTLNNTTWLSKTTDRFGVDEGGMEALLKDDNYHSTCARLTHEDDALILLTGRTHYVFIDMLTQGRRLPKTVCTPKAAGGSDEGIEQLQIETTLGELIGLVENITEMSYGMGAKKRVWVLAKAMGVKPNTLDIASIKTAIIRWLRSLSKNMNTKIVVVREVFDADGDKKKPAWASGLIRDLNSRGDENGRRRRLAPAPVEKCNIVIDIGTKKMSPTMKDGTQFLYAMYDTEDPGFVTVDGQRTAGFVFENNQPTNQHTNQPTNLSNQPT